MKVIDNLRVTTINPFFQNPRLELLSKLNWNICIDAFPIFSSLYEIALRSTALSQLLKVSKVEDKTFQCVVSVMEQPKKSWWSLGVKVESTECCCCCWPTSSLARFDVTGLTSLSTNQSWSRDQPTNERPARACHTGK